MFRLPSRASAVNFLVPTLTTICRPPSGAGYNCELLIRIDPRRVPRSVDCACASEARLGEKNKVILCQLLRTVRKRIRPLPCSCAPISCDA